MNGVHRAQTDRARFDLISHETYTKHLSKSKSILTFKQKLETHLHCLTSGYLTIIPQARMDSESIAHEAEGQMSYWLRGYEGERNNYCFSKIQLVGDSAAIVLVFRASAFCY